MEKKDYIDEIEGAIGEVINNDEVHYMFASQDKDGKIYCLLNGEDSMIAESIFCTLMTADNEEARVRLFNIVTDVMLNIISSETPLAENIKGRILEYLYTVNNKALN